jgi:hypothetical protein
MIAPRLLRKFGICVPLIATLSLAAYAGSAAAEAAPSTSTTTTYVTGPDVDLCTGLSGIVSGTFTEETRVVDNADGTTHEEITLTLDSRSDWSDGTYLIAHSVGHLEFQASPGQTSAEFSFTQQDRGTIYSPAGQTIGWRTVFNHGHITWHDGTPIVISGFQMRVTCH